MKPSSFLKSHIEYLNHDSFIAVENKFKG